MDDPRMLKPHTNDDRSAPSGAGSGAAWLAQCGMVALLVVEESSATRDENITVQSAATLAQEPADPTPDREPEEALLIRLSAQKLWAEGQSSAHMRAAWNPSICADPSATVRRRR